MLERLPTFDFQRLTNHHRATSSAAPGAQKIAALLAPTLLSCVVSLSAVAQNATDGSGSSAGELDTITVTAQRREERLQEVPLAVTVLTPEVLQERRINSSDELAEALPGLVNVSNQSSGSFAIRGQGPSFGSAPGSYVYFAEVPMLSIPTNTEPSGIDTRPGTFFDMQGVELLKGPQGTLFGRNATGGNVLFVPRKPTNDFEGYVQGQVGNYNDRAFEGAVNFPLIDHILAVRVSGATETRNGYVRDVGPFFPGKDYENINYLTGRVAILFTPNEKFDDYFIGRYYQSHTNGVSFVEGAIAPDFPAGINDLFPDRLSNYAQQQALGPRRVSYDSNVYDDMNYWQLINNASFHITDHVTVKNILSYADSAESLGLDVDGTADPVLNQTNAYRPTPHARIYTGELNVSGSTLADKLDFALGIYADEGLIKNRVYDFAFYPFVPGNGAFGDPPAAPGITAAPGLPLYLALNGETRSKAVYTQETFNFGYLAPVLDGLKLTGGYRYTRENGDAYQNIVISFGPSGSPGSYENSYNSYNVTLSYQLNPDTIFYVSDKDAYKSGGVNVQLAATDPGRFYAPEQLITQEVGAKTDLKFGNVTTLIDIDAFTGGYKNIQRSVVDPARAVAAFTTNVARARIWGVETNLTARVGSRLQFNENYAYTASGYTKINDPAAVAVLAGSNLPYVAKNKSVTSATVDLLQDSAFGTLALNANYSYTSRISQTNTNFVGLLGNSFAGVGLWNAALSWKQSQGGHVSGRVFVNNVANKLYATGIYDFSSTDGFASERYGAPRTFGVQVRYEF